MQPNPTTDERFWSRVAITPGCWLWLGGRNNSGYGSFTVSTHHREAAHRYAYRTLVGPIPDGLDLDHVRARGCAHRHCVNPDHLQPVDRRTNALRGDGFSAVHASKTACAHGHPFTPENTYVYLGRKYPRRTCRVCLREWGLARNARRKAARRGKAA